MSWVHDHYKYFNSFSAGTVYWRQMQWFKLPAVHAGACILGDTPWQRDSILGLRRPQKTLVFRIEWIVSRFISPSSCGFRARSSPRVACMCTKVAQSPIYSFVYKVQPVDIVFFRYIMSLERANGDSESRRPMNQWPNIKPTSGRSASRVSLVVKSDTSI